MSDVFDGPGSWMASDGLWYPPERHPDELYRKRFAAPQPSPEPATEFPAVELRVEDDDAATDSAETSEAIATPYSELARAEPEALADTQALPTIDAHTTVVETHSVPESQFVEAVVTPDRLSAQVAETAELSGTDLKAEMVKVAEQRALIDQQTAQQQTQHQTQQPDLPDELEGELATGDESEPAVQAEELALAERQEIAKRQIMAEQAALRKIPTTTVDVSSAPSLDGQADVAATALPSTPAPSQPDPASFSVASTDFTAPTVRPKFDDTIAPSVVAAPPRQKVGHTELELDRPTAEPPVRSTLTAATETANIPSSRAMVRLPSTTAVIATARDRIIAGALFLSGVALIIGSFLDWTAGNIVQSGWERTDGVLTVIAGIVGASMAGPIFVGFRHSAPKALAIIAGVVSAIVLGLVAVTSVLGSVGVDFGIGYYVVLAATAVMIIAGVTDRGEAEI